MVKHRAIVHGYFFPELSISEVWPITYFAVADPDDVGHSIARHIGKKNGLLFIGKHNMGTSFLIECFSVFSGPGKTISPF